MALERTLLYGFTAVVVLSPLPFGAVQPWASATLAAACLSLGALWAIGRGRRGLPPFPRRDPVLIGGALFILVGLVQVIPLPVPLLERLSPKAVELRERYEPAAVTAPGDPAPGAARRAGWRPISLYPWATRQATLRFAACLMAALITIDFATAASTRRVLVIALLAGGAFQAVYGLAEYVSGRQHIFGYEKEYYTDVATGTFINRNHLAGYLEMILPLSLALAASAATALRSRRGAPLAERLVKASERGAFAAAALLVLSLVMSTALACTGSRMGIISTLAGLLSVGCLAASRGRGRGYAAAAVLVVGATLLVFSQAEAYAPILDRFRLTFREFEGSLGRWSIWGQAYGMAAAFPLFGAGLGVFPYLFGAFRASGEGFSVAHAHNDYLELAAEVGGVGVLAALIGVALIARSIPRRPEGRPEHGFLGYAAASGIVAMLFHSLADFNLAIPSNALTMAVLSGLVLWWLRAPVIALAPPGGTPRARPAKGWIAPCLPAALAVVALAPLMADAVASRGARAGGTAPGVSRLALRLDGDNADRWFDAAARSAIDPISDLEVLAAAPAGEEGRRKVAGRYIERRLLGAMMLQARGLTHDPTSGEGHLQLGRLQVARCAAASLAGDDTGRCLGRAVAELTLATRLDPMSASAHAEAARVLVGAWPILDDESRGVAAPIIGRANAMNPSDPGLRAASRAVGIAPAAERRP